MEGEFFLLVVILVFSIFGIIAVIMKGIDDYELQKTLLGNIYRKKFNLKYPEVKYLNCRTEEIREHFTEDFCIEAVIKLYVSIVKDLSERRQEERTFRPLVKTFLLEQQEQENFNFHLISCCIHMVSYRYGYVSYQKDALYSELLGDEVYALIKRKESEIEELSEDNERKLFSHDYTRWTRMYDMAVGKFNVAHPELFYEDICKIASFNKIGVVILRSIYYKAYNFLVDYDKVHALKLYICYLSVKSVSETFKHKAISKRNVSKLFSTNKQQEKFERICAQFRINGESKKAFEEVEELYLPEKRKISLHVESIQAAKAKHREVAQILDAYLNDEDTDGEDADEMQKKEVVVDLHIPKTPDYKKELLDLFISKSFSLNREEVDIFVVSRGLFRDQFIESINDSYYELLDDLLIEEDGDNYVLNEEYYQQIAG